MKQPHRQIKVKQGAVTMTVNVPDHRLLKAGNHLRFQNEEPPGCWVITDVGENLTDKADLNRSWDNNI